MVGGRVIRFAAVKGAANDSAAGPTAAVLAAPCRCPAPWSRNAGSGDLTGGI